MGLWCSLEWVIEMLSIEQLALVAWDDQTGVQMHIKVLESPRSPIPLYLTR